ncbi:MAG: putative transport system ATP-binding protein [Thermodesulfobacteriota bacterium]|nr:putative transport system ATP-binding protein [Thermodesulfobacteriota bacterium]
MAIVECVGVKKTYQQGKVAVDALQGIDLSVDRGEFIALAGPSGSGKTTVLNLIGGLDDITQGRIVVDGQDITRLKSSQLADMRLHKIGFVFQSYNLVPVLSAVENVEFVMMLQGIPRSERLKRSHAILEEVGLVDLMGRRPAEMSGGQQQRVAVARAIVSEPAIVLADEPTANLDSKTGERLLALMKELNRSKGITFIFSTHDKMVMERAQRIVLLRDGMVVDTVINDR